MMSSGKARIRKEALARRAALGRSQVVKAGRLIQEAVLALPEFEQAECVCSYVAFEDEVGTDQIVKVTLEIGKKLCVPAWNDTAGEYGLVFVEASTKFLKGKFGAMEPVERDWARAGECDLFVVPGVAFDPDGKRIGHGGGHYDRILGRVSGESGIVKAGLSFECQIFEAVPSTDHDCPMNLIVTEERVIRIQNRNE